ncbi:MAG: hypothetical protein J5854_06065 [Clostridia bacterium]|nr:hypothetical protein [Clostridia bacterium]
MGLFGRKYIYVFVCFPGGRHFYCYRTNDRSIRVNDRVIVPAGAEEKAAIVTHVGVYEKKNVPYPLDKTKKVIRKAIIGESSAQRAADMRIPIDISVKRVKTANGYADAVTDRDERRALRKRYKDKSRYRIVETKPVSKAYSITNRIEDRRSRRTGIWYKEEHLFGKAVYRCSRCGARYTSRQAVCPKCRSENGRIKNDPVWVDEMSLYDGE